MPSYALCGMRPTSPSRFLVCSTAALASVLMVHSLAQAGPFKASAPCEVPGLRDAILQQVNAVRARGYNCGGQVFGPADGVRWNEQLASAAALHSTEMAENNYFSHRSLSGTRVSQRAQAQGYKWRAVAENIAGGDSTVQGVMQGWLQSPSHCQAILEPAFAELAVACMARAGTTYGTYWTMVLGRRR